MQNELDIVRDVSRRLDAAGIGYMLTGCDRTYIEYWTPRLGLANLWKEIA